MGEMRRCARGPVRRGLERATHRWILYLATTRDAEADVKIQEFAASASLRIEPNGGVRASCTRQTQERLLLIKMTLQTIGFAARGCEAYHFYRMHRLDESFFRRRGRGRLSRACWDHWRAGACAREVS
jgi:hypothetical protein